MALDNGYHFAAQALPTPTDTPYDAPSMDISKQPPSPFSSKSPAPFPPSEESYFPKQQETTNDGNADRTSAHESRRLTPNNLGISLVAQIHSLKKELGGKNTMIESLEENLHKSRAENEQLTKDSKTQKVEVASVKKQMQSLESDMLRALEDIAKERDNAVENVTNTQKHLEEVKKKVRAQEEDANKAHALWDKDRENWDDKRRKMEGRLHIMEERLKTMVAEMLNVQNAGQKSPGIGNDVDEGMQDSWFGKGNDSSSIRATSRLSNRSIDEPYESRGIPNFRSSRMSGLHDLGGSQMSGLSLAEELEFSEDGDAAGVEDNDQDALPEETYPLIRRYSEDKKARKVMGFDADNNQEPLGDESSGQHSIGIINDYIDFPGKQLESHYTDTGTQFSPPPSPTQQAQEPISEKPIEQTEHAANQRRKRIAIPQIFVEQTPLPKVLGPKILSMISTSSQTIGQPEDPVSIAKVADKFSVPVPVTANEMKSASTQTIEDATPLLRPAISRFSHLSATVPVIEIHPPASRPSSFRNSVMLPPRTKNAACQADIEVPRNMKSTSMQTEETRIGQRPVKIPPRLLSSEFPTEQSPPLLVERRKQAGKILSPGLSRRNLRSPPMETKETQKSVTNARIKNTYSGNNDDGPLNHKQRSGPKRPIRSESLFAGFDVSSDDDPENAQDHFSDDEFLNAAPVRKTLSKVQNSWRLVPHLKDSVLERLESASEEAEDETHKSVPKTTIPTAKTSSQTTSKTFHTRPAESYRIASSNVKQPDIRRKALVSNGIAEHAQRGRSSSKSNVSGKEPAIPPPFPVPTRSSSRKVPLSASDGATSPSPYTTTFFSARQGHIQERPPIKRKTLRKVQSAAAVTQPPISMRPLPSQSLSASSTIPSSPKSPAPRRNQFILPYDGVAELPSHTAPPQNLAGETSVETPSEQTSVVDAIAQTMVGEWMWKYVRKRTSFGITESAQAEFEMGRNGDNGNGSGVRHKRWVWLAPFERSVIWSGKQPTSGPALLGKGGRKRMLSSKTFIAMR